LGKSLHQIPCCKLSYSISAGRYKVDRVKIR
jgi:hypothetical protein